MTKEEFNNKYKKYLVPRYYGLAISDSKVIEYLDELFENRLTKIPNFKYYQIKFKFGKVCFYCEEVPPQVTNKIEEQIQNIIA